MLKKIFMMTALAVAVTACSKTEKPNDIAKTASAPASQVASVATSAPVASTASSVLPASSVSSDMASTTASVATNDVTTPAKAISNANANGAENVALKADLVALFKTINEIDNKNRAKQVEIEKQMQAAKTPAEQKKVFEAIVQQLDVQKGAFEKLQFNDKRVITLHSKMIQSISDTRSAMSIMAKNPTATPETDPKIAQSLQKADKATREIQTEIRKLITEAGIDPKAIK